MKLPIIFDIETCPTPRALAMPPDEAWLTPPATYTKADTIAAYRAKQEESWPAERARRASLDPRLGRICAIGTASHGNPYIRAWIAPDETEERTALAEWWEYIAINGREVQLVGFACNGFDLPWILMRSALLRVPAPRRISVNRYDPSRTDCLDWADLLSNFGGLSSKGWTLDRYADWFGLPHTIGTGADVAAWVEAGEWGKVAEHLEADLRTTRALDALLRPVYCGGA